jgi:hypothetical protein
VDVPRVTAMRARELGWKRIASELGVGVGTLCRFAPQGFQRPGAGLKPNYAKRLLSGVKPVTALTVLWDRIFGKPKREIGVSGGLVHAHTRDPLLAALPKEALEALTRAYDDVLAKHTPPAPPVLEVAQDGPQNQTESKPAIEAEEVRSMAKK